jgi:hypothetical protein
MIDLLPEVAQRTASRRLADDQQPGRGSSTQDRARSERQMGGADCAGADFANQAIEGFVHCVQLCQVAVSVVCQKVEGVVAECRAVSGGLADVERDLIRTRTAEGRSRAQKRGQRMGRKPKLTEAQQDEARRRRAEGATLAELARSYGVGRSTISRLTA